MNGTPFKFLLFLGDMKSILAIFVLLIASKFVMAQNDTIVLFFDRSWKESDPDFAYYFAVAVKSGNYWERVDFYNNTKKVYMKGYFEDSTFKTKTGPFNYYQEDGKLKSKGSYLNDKRVGLWRSWHDNGKIQDSGYYNENGIPYGIVIGWHHSGGVSDSMILDKEGNGIKINYYENGAVRYKGPIAKGMQQGSFTYYRADGTKCQEASFDVDSVINYTCFTENGTLQQKDCYYEKESEFPGGEEGWKKYLINAMSKHLPKEYFNGDFGGTVNVQFIVDVEGKVTNIAIRNSTEPRLNDAALKIIKYSPKWIPAIQYNQKVKSYKIQPLVFKKSVEG